MATLTAAIAALERRVGFPAARSRVVARALREAGKMPAGGPGVAPEIDLGNFVDLVVAMASDQSHYKCAAAIDAFRAMTPEGADVSGAPASVPKSAGEEIDAIAALAAEGAPEIRGLKLEFVADWPELAIHWQDGTVSRFRERGELGSHWGAAGYRRSTTINMAAFADALADTFGVPA